MLERLRQGARTDASELESLLPADVTEAPSVPATITPAAPQDAEAVSLLGKILDVLQNNAGQQADAPYRAFIGTPTPQGDRDDAGDWQNTPPQTSIHYHGPIHNFGRDPILGDLHDGRDTVAS